MNTKAITALRMERQYLTRKANKAEYITLYCDMQQTNIKRHKGGSGILYHPCPTMNKICFLTEPFSRCRLPFYS